MDSEQMLRAAVVMREAAEMQMRAAETIQQVWQQMQVQLEPGYPLDSLIQALTYHRGD